MGGEGHEPQALWAWMGPAIAGRLVEVVALAERWYQQAPAVGAMECRRLLQPIPCSIGLQWASATPRGS